MTTFITTCSRQAPHPPPAAAAQRFLYTKKALPKRKDLSFVITYYEETNYFRIFSIASSTLSNCGKCNPSTPPRSAAAAMSALNGRRAVAAI